MVHSNLMLHCGAHGVSRPDLSNVLTPRATDTWQPIPHDDLLYQVESCLDQNNLTIVEEAHALTHDGSRYFGLLQIDNGHPNGEYSFILGVRNSHDKRFPAGLVAGSSVFVCDNLAFWGEISVARKHTAHIMRDLPGLVDGAVQKLVSRWDDQQRRIGRYKNFWMSDQNAHHLTILALDRRAINVTQIPDVLKEWRTPSYDEFVPRNLWSWFNSCTEALKGNLTALPGRTQQLHRLCDSYAGVA